MNNATLLAGSIVLLAVGLIMRKHFERDKTISHMGITGIVLILVGALGVLYQVVNFVMFVLFP